MGKRDDRYKLRHEVELDEGFFEMIPDNEGRDRMAKELKENGGKYKRGNGSQKQSKVLELAEPKTVLSSRKYRHEQKKN